MKIGLFCRLVKSFLVLLCLILVLVNRVIMGLSDFFFGVRNMGNYGLFLSIWLCFSFCIVCFIFKLCCKGCLYVVIVIYCLRVVRKFLFMLFWKINDVLYFFKCLLYFIDFSLSVILVGFLVSFLILGIVNVIMLLVEVFGGFFVLRVMFLCDIELIE